MIVMMVVQNDIKYRKSSWQKICASVKNVPVNYAMRSSGPVTTSPPTASGMVSESPNLPARCSARYKCSLVPRRFSLQLPHSFSPRPVQLGSSYLGELRQRL